MSLSITASFCSPAPLSFRWIHQRRVPDSCCSTWHSLVLLTSVTSHQLRSFKLFFFFFASFSFFPCLFLWNNHALSQHVYPDFIEKLLCVPPMDLPNGQLFTPRCCLPAVTLSTQPESLHPCHLFIARWQLTNTCEKIIGMFVHLLFSPWKHAEERNHN